MLSVEYRTTADLVRAFVRSTIAIPTGLQNIFNTKHVNVFIYMLQTKSPRSYNAGKLRVDSRWTWNRSIACSQWTVAGQLESLKCMVFPLHRYEYSELKVALFYCTRLG